MSAHQVAGFDLYDDRDDRPRLCRTPEEMYDTRRARKNLTDCSLPEGFRLLTPRPVQRVMEGLLQWAFLLEFTTQSGQRWCYEQRYEMHISDDTQMEWAMTAFLAELHEAGYAKPQIRAVPFAAEGRSRVRQELKLVASSQLAGAPVGGGASFGGVRRPAMHATVAARWVH